jgi:hypothetical protein
MNRFSWFIPRFIDRFSPFLRFFTVHEFQKLRIEVIPTALLVLRGNLAGDGLNWSFTGWPSKFPSDRLNYGLGSSKIGAGNFRGISVDRCGSIQACTDTGGCGLAREFFW